MAKSSYRAQKEGMTDIDEYVGIADAKMYEMKMQRDEHRRV